MEADDDYLIRQYSQKVWILIRNSRSNILYSYFHDMLLPTSEKKRILLLKMKN